MEAKPKLRLFIKGTLENKTFSTFYFECKIYLKGERTISSMDIRIPKYLVPILAAMKKKIVTDIIDVKINIQDG